VDDDDRGRNFHDLSVVAPLKRGRPLKRAALGHEVGRRDGPDERTDGVTG
jgi:hypothetical protein